MRRRKKLSWISILEVIVIILLVFMIGFIIVCSLLIKNDGEAAPFFGLTFYKTSVDMMEDIPVGTIIIARSSEIESIRAGSVILCEVGEHKTTLLIRVVMTGMDEDGRQFYIVKFDVSDDNDTFRIYEENIIAKAVYQMVGFGKFLDFATSTLGIIISVALPLFLIIIFQVVRIVSIRKLEAEASSLEDIDELIISRDAEAGDAPVTFNEPKFIEDITDKFKIPPPMQSGEPVVSEGMYVSPVRQVRVERKPEPSLNINSRGRAEYTVSQTKAPAPSEEQPLFTYDRLPKKTVMSATGTFEVKREELYLNKPTKIEPESSKSKVDEFFETYSPSKGLRNATNEERIVFTPHLSNVVPDKILDIQAEATAPMQARFEDSIKAYYEKDGAEKTYVPPLMPEAAAMPETPAFHLPPKVSTIPEMAVVPKETIAPPKKKKSSKTVDELMNLISAEETKLKK